MPRNTEANGPTYATEEQFVLSEDESLYRAMEKDEEERAAEEDAVQQDKGA